MNKSELKKVVLVAIPYGIGKLILRDVIRNQIADRVVDSIIANNTPVKVTAKVGNIIEWVHKGETLQGVVIDFDLYTKDPVCTSNVENDGKHYCPSDYKIIQPDTKCIRLARCPIYYGETAAEERERLNDS
jgi:hypothetical protein